MRKTKSAGGMGQLPPSARRRHGTGAWMCGGLRGVVRAVGPSWRTEIAAAGVSCASMLRLVDYDT